MAKKHKRCNCKKCKKRARRKKPYPTNHPKEPTRHHILPKSRKVDSNIAIVPRQKHDTYHTLFHNLTPNEIIGLLVKEYWNGQWEWVWKALEDENL